MGEKEKLVRTCAQISSFPSPEESPTHEPKNESKNGAKDEPKGEKDLEEDERKKHFDTMLEMLEEIEEDVVTDGNEMVAIRACRVTRTSTQKVIPGSEVTLELQIESRFPR